MQKDVFAMEQRGYRVVATEKLELPVLLAPGAHASYYRVTYELREPASS